MEVAPNLLEKIDIWYSSRLFRNYGAEEELSLTFDTGRIQSSFEQLLCMNAAPSPLGTLDNIARSSVIEENKEFFSTAYNALRRFLNEIDRIEQIIDDNTFHAKASQLKEDILLYQSFFENVAALGPKVEDEQIDQVFVETFKPYGGIIQFYDELVENFSEYLQSIPDSSRGPVTVRSLQSTKADYLRTKEILAIAFKDLTLSDTAYLLIHEDGSQTAINSSREVIAWCPGQDSTHKPFYATQDREYKIQSAERNVWLSSVGGQNQVVGYAAILSKDIPDCIRPVARTDCLWNPEYGLTVVVKEDVVGIQFITATGSPISQVSAMSGPELEKKIA